jgi:hypothetical protein
MAELKPTTVTIVELTAKQYAAIHLCVPDSGNDELDAMIQRAQRERLAGEILVGVSYGPNKNLSDTLIHWCYEMADAVIAAGGGETVSEKHCPAGKCDCGSFGDEFYGKFQACHTPDKMHWDEVQENMEVCPWPSRQVRVEPHTLTRKCPMDFSAPCHEGELYDCSWLEDCPIDNQPVQPPVEPPTKDDMTNWRTPQGAYNAGRAYQAGKDVEKVDMIRRNAWYGDSPATICFNITAAIHKAAKEE